MMTGPTDADGDETATGRRRSAAFEAAQEELLESVGLEATSTYVDPGGQYGTLHALEVDPAADGVPAVFVHGTGAFAAFLAPLMARVERRRLIALDRPGYGLSEPHVYTEANLLESLVEPLAGALDALDVDRADFVGHSMGAHAAIRFARTHPDRVRRLGLVGAVPTMPGTSPPLPLRLLTVPGLGGLLRRLQRGGEAGVLDIAAVFGERETVARHPALVRAIAAHEADQTAARATTSEYGSLLSIRGWRRSVSFDVADLRALRHPVTVVWGEHDPLGRPAAVRSAIELIDDLRFETVEAGHIPYLGHAERCAESLLGRP